MCREGTGEVEEEGQGKVLQKYQRNTNGRGRGMRTEGDEVSGDFNAMVGWVVQQ